MNNYKKSSGNGRAIASPYKTTFQAIILFILALTLAACTPASGETATPTLGSLPPLEPVDLPPSAWGTVELIAQAETLDAPVFLPLENDSQVFAWTGSQENESRIYSQGRMGNAQIMPLKAYFPFQTQLFPNPDGILILWLDRTREHEDIRLQMGLFSPDGLATLGPGDVSNLRTQHYSAVLMDDGFLYTVWSGGIGSVSNLYLQTIDSLLRPISSHDLRVDADYPALLKDDEDLYLFWLEDNGRAVYSALLKEDYLSNIRRIARSNIAGTVAIDDFRAGFDGAYVYLFWNLRQLDGSRQVLFSSGLANAGDLSRPIQLGISANGGLGFETAYALEDLHAAQLSENNPVTWAIPAPNSEKMLPVAINLGEELGVAFFQDGQLVAYQSVVSSSSLLGSPNIQILNENQLALSWLQASNRGYANLFFSSSQTSP
jgi:hypothetical protein